MDFTKMPLGAAIFLFAVLFLFTAMDVFMLIKLTAPGDERNQIIVWKSAAFTLCAVSGSAALNIIESLITGSSCMINPFIHLNVTAILFFCSLMFYKRKHGG